MKKMIKRSLKFLYNKIITFHFERGEIKKIHEKRRIEIQNRVTLNSNQINDVKKFYKCNLGKNIDLNWHKNYYAISGKFDYKFFPEILYIPHFERICNSPKYKYAIADKNLLELCLSGINFAKPIKSIISCQNGILLDQNKNLITIEEAEKILLNYDEFIVKLSVDSCSGKGCKLIRKSSDCNFETIIKNILRDSGKDFVVQEKVLNCKDLYDLNPTSLNTFRIITYILDGKIFHMPALLRIGRNKSFLDNAHAGGIFIGVSDDGLLLESAHSEFGDLFYSHPDSGVVFKDYKINNFPKVIETAHKLQSLFPHVGCINWDITINDKNEIIIVEANTFGGSVWLPQMAHGKGAFGDNTERVLQIIKQNNNLY